MKPVVLDTCALIYLLLDKPVFSKSTMLKINQGSRILSISFAEIACKVKTKKLSLGKFKVKDFFQEMREVENASFINIDAQMWIDAVSLRWSNHKDPADRLLVSYAKNHDLEIVTSDRKMKQYYKSCIL